MAVLTSAHAAAHIDSGVVYDPGHGAREDGTIVEVRGDLVMVRYRGDVSAKATPADRLALLADCSCACQLTPSRKAADHQCRADGA